jgi:hypothetical protein
VIIKVFKISVTNNQNMGEKYVNEQLIKHNKGRTFENHQQQTVSSVYQNTECLPFLDRKYISSITSYNGLNPLRLSHVEVSHI